MFLFPGKSRKAHRPDPHAVNGAPSTIGDAPATVSPEDAWWMDSAHELQQGLEVVEIDELPEGLFDAPAAAARSA